jgi:hypothetical protein
MSNLLAIRMPRREPFFFFTLKWTGRKLSIGVSKPNARDVDIVVAQVRREL